MKKVWASRKCLRRCFAERLRSTLPEKRGNACEGEGASTKLSFTTLRGRDVLLKSRMRENLTSGSMRGHIDLVAITPTGGAL